MSQGVISTCEWTAILQNKLQIWEMQAHQN